MNQSLWLKHIEDNIFNMTFELKDDKSNVSDFYCADVVGNRRFAQNYGGHPRSDIAEINAQVSLQSAENLLRDLQVFELDNANAGLSDAEIMLGHRSKYCQLPSEQLAWLEEQLELRDLRRIQSESKEPSIQFENQDKDVIDNA